jgi:hypothetical protein
MNVQQAFELKRSKAHEDIMLRGIITFLVKSHDIHEEL